MRSRNNIFLLLALWFCSTGLIAFSDFNLPDPDEELVELVTHIYVRIWGTKHGALEAAEKLKLIANEKGYSNAEITAALLKVYENPFDDEKWANKPLSTASARKQAVYDLKEFPLDNTIEIYENLIVEESDDSLKSFMLGGYFELIDQPYNRFIKELVRVGGLGRRSLGRIYFAWTTEMRSFHREDERHQMIIESLIDLVLSSKEAFTFYIYDLGLSRYSLEYVENYQTQRSNAAKRFLDSPEWQDLDIERKENFGPRLRTLAQGISELELLDASDEGLSRLHIELVWSSNIGSSIEDLDAWYRNHLVPVFQRHGILLEEERAAVLMQLFEKRDLFIDAHPNFESRYVGNRVLELIRLMQSPGTQVYFENLLREMDPRQSRESTELLRTALKEYVATLDVPVNDFLEKELEDTPAYGEQIFRRTLYELWLGFLERNEDASDRVKVESVFQNKLLMEKDPEFFYRTDRLFQELSEAYRNSRERYKKVKALIASERFENEEEWVKFRLRELERSLLETP